MIGLSKFAKSLVDKTNQLKKLTHSHSMEFAGET
jgi:hypothetical protein